SLQRLPQPPRSPFLTAAGCLAPSTGTRPRIERRFGEGGDGPRVCEERAAPPSGSRELCHRIAAETRRDRHPLRPALTTDSVDQPSTTQWEGEAMHVPGKLLWVLACAAAVAAVAVPTASADAATECNGVFSNTTLNGGVVVKEGDVCVLDHVTVNGGLTGGGGPSVLTFL